MRRAWPLGFLLMFACDSGGAPTNKDPSSKSDTSAKTDASAETDASTKTPAKAKTSAKADAAGHAPELEPKKARELRRKLKTLLNEGRALTKKGEYDKGITKYREALTIDASDISVLGELGWAAYKAGDLKLAHQTTFGALKFAREDRQRGMLLYNLGRVEEDRGDKAAAIESYTASLAARPNKTVQARLAKLSSSATPAPAASDSCGPLAVLARDLPDLAAACKQLSTLCEDFQMEEGEPCSCEPTLVAAPTDDPTWGLLAFNNEGFPEQRAWFPVVKTDKGWNLFAEVVSEYNPGMFGIFEEAQFGESSVEPLLTEGSQLLMHFTKTRVDRDMGLNEIEIEEFASLVVCTRDGGSASCTRALLESSGYTREIEFEGEDVDDIDEEHTEGLPISEGFDASFEFSGGVLTVHRTETRGGYDRVGAVEEGGWVLADGTYPLAQLLGLSAD